MLCPVIKAGKNISKKWIILPRSPLRLSKIDSDNLELTFENISLAAIKDNEKGILTQKENDFDVLNLAIDVRMEFEDCEKGTRQD